MVGCLGAKRVDGWFGIRSLDPVNHQRPITTQIDQETWISG